MYTAYVPLGRLRFRLTRDKLEEDAETMATVAHSPTTAVPAHAEEIPAIAKCAGITVYRGNPSPHSIHRAPISHNNCSWGRAVIAITIPSSSGQVTVLGHARSGQVLTQDK
ncbi:hypothetical protein BaRGS_00002436 [Batillaria attramentaria]|uniref:Uncharacterized protein n=1 Tax=Batillaria attramentaria TaxID=370345 RepID=A0ABD0M3D0_9CAEN